MSDAAPRRGRIRLILLGLLMGLLATELALQLLALVVWSQRDPGEVAGDGPVVLCVGDSFTYGMGSTGPESTYPARTAVHLERLLGHPVTVVNGGWAGRNSRHVLLNLPGQLRTFAPAVVCILVGVNDLGFEVPRVTAAEETADEGADEKS